MNGSTGLISGTSPNVSSTTTYSFQIGATDAENQTTARSFSITINADVVTWNSPSNGTTYTSYANSAIANVTMSATSAAGQSITYTANSLPTGLSISGANITGTPTVVANSSSLLTATAAVTGKTATDTINWVINVANDPYFNLVTLLLNGETNTNTYIQDASTNNFALTVSGSATPNRFSPLWGNGYYGYNFSSSYLSYTQPAALTGDFTIEGWVNPSSLTTYNMIWASSSPNNYFCLLWGATSSVFGLNAYNGSVSVSSSSSVTPINQWHHIAFVRISGVLYFYIDGTQTGSGAFTGTIGSSGTTTIGYSTNYSSTYYFNGSLSNFRIVNGVGVYTGNFTVPTSPLTVTQSSGTNIAAITSGQTQLLTAQNNNVIDNSTNTSTLTLNSTVKVVSNQPFGAVPSGVQNYGSSLFDGSTGYLTYTPSTSVSFGTSNFTVEMWIYLTASPTTQIILDARTSGTTNTWAFGWGEGNAATSQFCWTGYTGSTTSVYDTSTTRFSTNQWYHIAYSRSGTTGYLYVNGVQVATGTDSTNYNVTSPTVHIGSQYSPNYYFPGYISNLRIVNGTAVYTSAFTPPTSPLTAVTNTSLLTLQYKNGVNNNTFYDDSTNNFAITRTGTPTQGTFSPFSQTGWSNYFGTAASDVLTFPTNASYAIGTSNFTVEAWICLTANVNTSGQAQVIMENAQAGSYGITLYYTSGSWALFVVSTTPVINFAWTPTIDTWYHIAAVRSGTSTNQTALYINGVSVATGTAPSSQTQFQACIGGINWAGSGWALYGYMSNFRYSNNARYSGNFTPSTTPFTSDANTLILTCQSNRFVDNSSLNAAPTITGSVSVQAFSPFQPSLVYSPSTNGVSIYFNGSTDYLVNLSAPVFNFGTNPFTIELWLYPNSVSGRQVLVSGTGGSGTGPIFALSNTISNGKVDVGVGIYGSADTVNTNPNYPITPLSWNHIALVRTGTGSNQAFIYVNGVLKATGTLSTNFTTNGVGIGQDYGATEYLNGYLSGVRVINGQALYTTTFTPPTVPPTPTQNTSLLLLGTNSGIQDATGKNNIITVGATKTQANTVKFGSGALYFDGSTSYIVASRSDNLFQFGTGDFTVECWVYLNAYNASTYSATILDWRTASNANPFTISIDNLGKLGIYDGSNVYQTTSTVGLTTWTHIAWVRVSGVLKMFINGVSGYSATYSGNLTGTSNNLTIGCNVGGQANYYLNGYLDDLRVTKGVGRYSANFTAPSSALIAV